jgi:hypothetical protein
MVKKIRVFLIVLIVFFLLLPLSAQAQSYSFSVPRLVVDVYWNEDGSMGVAYTIEFQNEPGASPIDFVDIGMPTSNFSDSGIEADINGQPVDYVSRSEYQGSGSGLAVALGNRAIQPGESGTVRLYVPNIFDVLFVEDQDSSYASGMFSPTWFSSDFVNGETDMTVTFHLPPGVQSEEPRWHASPFGWPEAPETGEDDEGRPIYVWHNPSALASRQYEFGASFPASYVPSNAVRQPSFSDRTGFDPSALIPFFVCGGFILFFGFTIVSATYAERKRKLQYLPPRIAIEGHGIKRGLTAIEAAILLEQPMDKILTMILFAVIKKNAAEVMKKDPLELDAIKPAPEGLYEYEQQFLQAFAEKSMASRRKLLQQAMINLVESVAQKMKGFSRKETLEYYRGIVDRAWQQVEAAETPEVKSQKFDEVMEWTMLDTEYDRRTRNVFQTGPVYVPTWWGRYDPGFGRGAPSPATVSTPSTSGGVGLPHLPGSDFAASVVNGVQNFSAGVVGNLTEFTTGVTQKTNPIPVPTRSSSRGGGGSRSGGCACACACACAGCACACAGGGR